MEWASVSINVSTVEDQLLDNDMGKLDRNLTVCSVTSPCSGTFQAEGSKDSLYEVTPDWAESCPNSLTIPRPHASCQHMLAYHVRKTTCHLRYHTRIAACACLHRVRHNHRIDRPHHPQPHWIPIIASHTPKQEPIAIRASVAIVFRKASRQKFFIQRRQGHLQARASSASAAETSSAQGLKESCAASA